MSPKAHRPADNHPWRRVAQMHSEANTRRAWCSSCGLELVVTVSPQGVNRHAVRDLGGLSTHSVHACARGWKLRYQGANPDPEKPPSVRIPRP